MINYNIKVFVMSFEMDFEIKT